MSDPDATGDHKEETVPPPFWLDHQLVEQALRNAGDKNPVVTSISVSLAVAAGDNYISTVYRVKATLFDGKQRPFIIKGPAVGGMSELAKNTSFFQREIDMFTDCIPKMEALLEAAAPGRFPPFSPRCYHHGSSPVDFLIMEDMGHLGFKMADRKRGLGLKHCLLALRGLARFHAASHALLKRQPELMEKLDYTLKPDNQSLMDYFKGLLQATAIACRSWPGFEEIANRLEKFKSIAGVVHDKLNKPKHGAFNVITHGDFWVNNIMLRYEDGYPVELRLVDQQLSHASSPAIDILHFFATSLSDDVDIHYQPLLLREYHFELKTMLELLGHEAPSLDSLLAAIEAHGTYGLFLVLEIPLVVSEVSVNIDALSSGDYAEFVQLLNAPRMKSSMQRKLTEFARRGWLPE